MTALTKARREELGKAAAWVILARRHQAAWLSADELLAEEWGKPEAKYVAALDPADTIALLDALDATEAQVEILTAGLEGIANDPAGQCASIAKTYGHGVVDGYRAAAWRAHETLKAAKAVSK